MNPEPLYFLIHNVPRYFTRLVWREDRLLILFDRSARRWINKELRAKFDHEKIMQLLIVVCPMEKPGAWIVVNRSQVQPIIPEFDILEIRRRLIWGLKADLKGDQHIELSQNKYFNSLRAFSQFWKKIPMFARQELKKYNGKYWWRCWQLLERFGYEALDISRSTPALFLIIAHVQYFKKCTHPYRKIGRLLRKKQKDILQELGFVGRKSTIHMLRKFNRTTIELTDLKLFQTAHRNEQFAKYMRHLPVYNRLVLNVFRKPEWEDIYTFRFIREISQIKDSDNQKEILSWIETIQEEKLLAGRNRRLHKLSNLQKLMHELVYEKMSPIKYNLPDVDIPDWIEPIRDSKELYREGYLDMHHCIYDYHEDILEGDKFACRVRYQGHRATLLLKKVGKKWVADDVRGKYNASVEISIKVAISKWFNFEKPKNDRVFGPPPLEGTDWLRPLINYMEFEYYFLRFVLNNEQFRLIEEVEDGLLYPYHFVNEMCEGLLFLEKCDIEPGWKINSLMGRFINMNNYAAIAKKIKLWFYNHLNDIILPHAGLPETNKIRAVRNSKKFYFISAIKLKQDEVYQQLPDLQNGNLFAYYFVKSPGALIFVKRKMEDPNQWILCNILPNRKKTLSEKQEREILTWFSEAQKDSVFTQFLTKLVL